MSVRHLEALFRPRSVALIGASDRPGSLGAVVLRNLKQGGFQGPLWLVNRRHAQVDGETAWPTVAALPQVPDLAVVCTPAHTVPGLIAELGRKGTRAAIVMTTGLKQPNPDGTGTLEQAMLEAARPSLLRILGPNCIGALVPAVGLNASFAPGNASPGRLAFVTQSGALATAMLDWAQARGIGFSHFISLGDSADVDFGDVLDYLASDSATRAILVYMESVKAARKFMSAARAASRNKPVIVVKAGRGADGARAAASHTGALAGADVVFDAAFRRAGMLRVDTLEDLFDAAETLAHARPVLGERLAILTNGGGLGVLAADALDLHGGELATLSPATLAALSACLPSTWSHGNPVDIVGDAPLQRYLDGLQVLLAAPEVDGVLFMHAPTAMVSATDIAAGCLPLLAQAGKPVLTCWLGGTVVAAARTAMAQAGLPSYDTPERAVAAWLQLVQHARNQAALRELPASTPPAFVPQRDQAQALVAQAAQAGQEWLTQAQVQSLLDIYGIPTQRSQRVGTVDEAVACAARLGFPVALKIVSPQIVHKSDVGGVVLGLDSEAALRTAAQGMLERVARLRPQAEVQGFTVQAMVVRPQAHELIVGISTDPVFGPVLLFGEGGTAVELSQNHAVALPPLNTALARDLVQRSGLARLLAGYRERPAVPEAALLHTLHQVAQLACDLPLLAELDINPLLADAQGVLALDVRIRLHGPGRGQPVAPAIRPYPQELEHTVAVAGTLLQVRPIQPEDGERLQAFYAHASAADMRLRFFLTRREVPHSELARYSQIDYDREMTFIALTPGDPAAMAAEIRVVCDPDNRIAEFALQVASAWQGQGLGRHMLDAMLAYLRQRGTQEVVGQCLVQNKGMAALARKAGFSVQPGPGADILMLHRALGAPAASSMDGERE